MTIGEYVSGSPSEIPQNADISQSAVSEWCELHDCSREDIATKITGKNGRTKVGSLVFVLREHAGLEVIPTAQTIGIHPSSAALLMRDFRIELASGNQTAKDWLTLLRERLGLPTTEEHRSPLHVENTTRKKRGYVRRNYRTGVSTESDTQKLSAPTPFERNPAHAPHVLQQLVSRLGKCSIETMLSGERAEYASRPRRVAMYLARCLNNNNLGSYENLGQKFKKTSNTLTKSVHKMKSILGSKDEREPSTILLIACCNELEVDWKTLDPRIGSPRPKNLTPPDS